MTEICNLTCRVHGRRTALVLAKVFAWVCTPFLIVGAINPDGERVHSAMRWIANRVRLGEARAVPVGTETA